MLHHRLLALREASRKSQPQSSPGHSLTRPSSGEERSSSADSRIVPPLLAALVAVQLFTARGHPAVDARATGVATATAIFLLRQSLLLALATAALVTALLRLA